MMQNGVLYYDTIAIDIFIRYKSGKGSHPRGRVTTTYLDGWEQLLQHTIDVALTLCQSSMNSSLVFSKGSFQLNELAPCGQEHIRFVIRDIVCDVAKWNG